jgi:hypothetical protein
MATDGGRKERSCRPSSRFLDKTSIRRCFSRSRCTRHA